MGYSNHAEVSDIRYEAPSLTEGEKFEAQGLWTPIINPNNPLYRTLFKPFDSEQYLYPRLPVDMGHFDISPFREVPNVLRLPIKYPTESRDGLKLAGDDCYHIPKELLAMMPLINRVANYERNINPRYDEVFCHITIDQSDVPRGQYHRFPGFHGDGFQGAKFSPYQHTMHKEKITVEHSYILVTAPGTELCLQPFFVTHLDEAKHSEFLEFDEQAKKANIYRTLPSHLYIFDPYIVHRSPVMLIPSPDSKQGQRRTFIRITFTFSELDHPKNTVNPMFPPYEYEDRIDIRENLARFGFGVPYHLYGLQK